MEQFKWPCSQEKLNVLFGEVSHLLKHLFVFWRFLVSRISIVWSPMNSWIGLILTASYYNYYNKKGLSQPNFLFPNGTYDSSRTHQISFHTTAEMTLAVPNWKKWDRARQWPRLFLPLCPFQLLQYHHIFFLNLTTFPPA